eukprot:Ihof_evm3s445 gene=Ihof_evmTU3s445
MDIEPRQWGGVSTDDVKVKQNIEEQMPNIPLKDSIDFSNLKEGIQFEVQIDNPSETDQSEITNESDEDLGSDDGLTDFLKDEGTTDPAILAMCPEILPSMAQLRMTYPLCVPLNNEPMICKEILEVGTGNIVPPEANVIIHYQAYFDKDKIPFDATTTLKNPKAFQLKHDEVILGLDLAVATMCLHERARFLIPYQYGFGETGCVPRIPGKANLIFEIVLLHFVNKAPLNNFYKKTAKKAIKTIDPEKLLEMAEFEKTIGNDHFRFNRTTKARNSYNKGITLFSGVKIPPGDTQRRVDEMKAVLYCNLSLVFLVANGGKDADKALKAAENALELVPDHPKALFRAAKANML